MAVNYPEHITLDEAWKILSDTFNNYSAKFKKQIKIADALNSVLSEDITAARNVPHYAASAVDGYAVKAYETAGASAAVPVKISKNNCQWMNTGAALPDWADAVLMVEDSSENGDEILVYKSLPPSANVRPLGEDVMAGQIIAREGELVSPPLISLFLCAGIEKVPVYAEPKIVFIPTGNEIISQKDWLAGEKQKSGTVAESNSLFIAATLKKFGFDIDVTPILPDVPEILEKCVKDCSEKYDVVLVGAGSAKGRRDHTREIFEKLGKILFRGVRIKPGRPAMAAEINGKPVVCLPGFPMSTAVALWTLVCPLLNMIGFKKIFEVRDIAFHAAGADDALETELLVQHSSSAGIEEWLRMKTAMIDGKVYSWPLTSGASVLWALAEADGLAVLPREALECERGTKVNVRIMRKFDLSRRALFQGSDDPALQLLITPIRRRGADLACRTVGSMGGLAALSRGECHVAAAHLLDENTGNYNDIFIERFYAGADWLRFLVFYRTQGIIVRHGNPRGIKTFSDLCQKGIIFSNRQPGAGTRVLFDCLLKKEGVPSSEIQGYSQICTTHMEAANRVSSGLADAALGIKSAADALGLDFIPITEEPYELVVPKKYIDHPGIAAMLDALNDKDWRDKVEKMGGYRWAQQN